MKKILAKKMLPKFQQCPKIKKIKVTSVVSTREVNQQSLKSKIIYSRLNPIKIFCKLMKTLNNKTVICFRKKNKNLNKNMKFWKFLKANMKALIGKLKIRKNKINFSN